MCVQPANGEQSPSGLDNRRIVPYNPYLLLRYICHLNVEVVASNFAIKYKCVFKGPDRTKAKLSAVPMPADAAEADPQSGVVVEEEGADELSDYESARWTCQTHMMLHNSM